MEQFTKWPVTVRWHGESPQGRISWFFRGISQNGNFYGDVQNTDLRKQLTIEGTLTDQDCRDVIESVDAIVQAVEPKHRRLIAGCKGLLASGLNRPNQGFEIIMYYDDSNSTNDICSAKFLELVEILRKYVPAEYR